MCKSDTICTTLGKFPCAKFEILLLSQENNLNWRWATVARQLSSDPRIYNWQYVQVWTIFYVQKLEYHFQFILEIFSCVFSIYIRDVLRYLTFCTCANLEIRQNSPIICLIYPMGVLLILLSGKYEESRMVWSWDS